MLRKCLRLSGAVLQSNLLSIHCYNVLNQCHCKDLKGSSFLTVSWNGHVRCVFLSNENVEQIDIFDRCVLYAECSLVDHCINILVVLIQTWHYHVLLSTSGWKGIFTKVLTQCNFIAACTSASLNGGGTFSYRSICKLIVLLLISR